MHLDNEKSGAPRLASRAHQPTRRCPALHTQQQAAPLCSINTVPNTRNSEGDFLKLKGEGKDAEK